MLSFLPWLAAPTTGGKGMCRGRSSKRGGAWLKRKSAKPTPRGMRWGALRSLRSPPRKGRKLARPPFFPTWGEVEETGGKASNALAFPRGDRERHSFKQRGLLRSAEGCRAYRACRDLRRSCRPRSGKRTLSVSCADPNRGKRCRQRGKFGLLSVRCSAPLRRRWAGARRIGLKDRAHGRVGERRLPSRLSLLEGEPAP